MILNGRIIPSPARAQPTKVKNDSAGFGLLLHHRGEELSAYMFRIKLAPDRARILKILPPPHPSVQLGRLDIVVEVGRWYQLAAAIHKDGTLEFQIDQQVLRVVNNNLSPKSGQAGLSVGGVQVRFDDVEITGENIPDGGARKITSRRATNQTRNYMGTTQKRLSQQEQRETRL